MALLRGRSETEYAEILQLDGYEIEGEETEHNTMEWDGIGWNVGKVIMQSTSITKIGREIHISHSKRVFVLAVLRFYPVDTLIVTEKYRIESQRSD